MQDEIQSSSSSTQYVNHAFLADIHMQLSDGVNSTPPTSRDHVMIANRAPLRRQESAASMAANALATMSRRATAATNSCLPKSYPLAQDGRSADKFSSPAADRRADKSNLAAADRAADNFHLAASSEEVIESDLSCVSDLAEFWREYKRSRKFEHPFGKNTDLLGQILCGEREEADENQTDSTAKLLIWIVFFCLMVGVAGAIILGAETAIRNSVSRNVTFTTADYNT